jgi:predicted DNA-binding WGR domain protein
VEIRDDAAAQQRSAISPATPLSDNRDAAHLSAGQPPNVRRLEFSEGKSSKFWEIAQNDCEVTVRYGRIGTEGQTSIKTFQTPERAGREVAKLTAEKLKKGYREVGT